MLYHDFLTNNNKLITKWVHYFPIYERHMRKFVNQSVNFWEIGIYRGGSLQMWKRYLGPFAKIVGIDINLKCRYHKEDQINICIGDQSDTTFLQAIIDKYGAPDIVLDDGSHFMKHVCASFDFLYGKLSKNGVYMVEDLHTSYIDKYGGGLRREGTFVERCKEMIDLINARHCNLPRSFADSTFSMSIYDSIAVFEKAEWTGDSLKSLVTPDSGEAIWHLEVASPSPFNTEAVEIELGQISSSNRVSLAELKSDVCIFGSGEIGIALLALLSAGGTKVECFLDNDKEKQGSLVSGLKVISPNDTSVPSMGSTIIAVYNKEHQNDIINQLKQLGVADETIYIVASVI